MHTILMLSASLKDNQAVGIKSCSTSGQNLFLSYMLIFLPEKIVYKLQIYSISERIPNSRV